MGVLGACCKLSFIQELTRGILFCLQETAMHALMRIIGTCV